MYVRMPIVGSGKREDPRTVMLPTWSMISEVAGGAAMIVWIHPDDEPDDHDPIGSARYPILNGVPVLIGLTPTQRQRWRSRIAARWQTIADFSQVDLL